MDSNDEYSDSAEGSYLRHSLREITHHSDSALKKRKRSGAKQGSPIYSLRRNDLSDLLDTKLTEHTRPIHERMDKWEKELMLKTSGETDSRLKSLEAENKRLREEVNSLQSFSRRNNLRIYGIRERKNENCEQLVLDALKKVCPNFNNRTFERVHRLGSPSGNDQRPILCKIFHFKDKLLLLNKRNQLDKQGIRMSDDFSHQVELNRKPLIPVLKEGYRLGLKPKLTGDKLYLNGKTYTHENLHDLPKDLQPEAISTKTNAEKGITAFFTMSSPLSNFYPCKFEVKGETYNCAEQFLTVKKARHFKDEETAQKLLQTAKPSQQKQIGKTVKTFDHQVWLRDSEELVYEGIFEKFSQSDFLKNFLLATGDNLLIEASKDSVWGVGLTMNDPNLWDTEKHAEGGNKLGRILMRIRSSLK